jgi:tRNA modification GTPase
MTVDFSDTIAAIATNFGEAGISIIRISGDNALAIAEEIFTPGNGRKINQIKSRVLINGWLVKNGKFTDEAMICVMRKPRSYTAEDVIEIYCHGGLYITRTALNMVLDAGARLAVPGEFTQRAFLNGRIDLTQAEAVNDLIRAKSSLELDLVINQLKGALYEKIAGIRDQVMWTLSLANAGIDFPEEDIVFTNRDEIMEKVESIIDELRQLVGSADTGIKIKEGYNIVLTGKPNVGKSSILNGLLGSDRAIVHQVPGTTRDTIEESFTIQGIPVSLIDTAGIHSTDDAVELEGINRAKTAIKKADLVLWVIDSSRPSFEKDYLDEFDLTGVPTVIILNKTDLIESNSVKIPDVLRDVETVNMSAHSKKDINELKNTIHSYISKKTGNLNELTMLTNIRQKRAAEKALRTMLKARESLDEDLGEEFLAVDFSQALSELGEIVGETTPDDMLNQIFSSFCIGK